MMSISHFDLMSISSERSDAGLSQVETVIDIRQDSSVFLAVIPRRSEPPSRSYSPSFPLQPLRFFRIDSACNSSR
jgi:hypothetical protein